MFSTVPRIDISRGDHVPLSGISGKPAPPILIPSCFIYFCPFLLWLLLLHFFYFEVRRENGNLLVIKGDQIPEDHCLVFDYYCFHVR
jgi:hypothetical protein